MMGKSSPGYSRDYNATVWNPANMQATRLANREYGERIGQLRERIEQERWLLAMTRKELGKPYIAWHKDALAMDAQRREVSLELMGRELAKLEEQRVEMIGAERARILRSGKRQRIVQDRVQ